MNHKVKHNRQSLGENKTGYRAENIFLHKWKRQEKSTFICIHCYALLIMYCYAKEMLIRYQLSITFMLRYCL